MALNNTTTQAQATPTTPPHPLQLQLNVLRAQVDALWTSKGPLIGDMDDDELEAFYGELGTLSDNIGITTAKLEAATGAPRRVGELLELQHYGDLLTGSSTTYSDAAVDAEMQRYRAELYGAPAANAIQQAALAAQAAAAAEEARVQAIHDAHRTPQAAGRLRAWAGLYARFGLPVLPRCADDPKIPSLRASTLPAGGLVGFNAAFAHWGREGHECDGISCAQGVRVLNGKYETVCIDLDQHGDDGRKSLHNWLQRNPQITVPPALCVGTDGDRGGLHIHMAVPYNRVNACCDGIGVLPGVDILYRGRNAIMPPTYRPDKLTEYQWLGLYDFATDSIIPLPESQMPTTKLSNTPPWSKDDANLSYTWLLTMLYSEGKRRKALQYNINKQCQALHKTPSQLMQMCGAQSFEELMELVEAQQAKARIPR